MKKRTLKNPRKVVWAMRDFINDIHDVTYEDSYLPAIKDETTEEFFDRFCDSNSWITTVEKATCKLVETEVFCAMLGDKGKKVFCIGYNIEDLYSEGSKEFRKNFCSRCSIGKGFATVTLALLHELGHFSSQQEFDNYSRLNELMKIFDLPVEEHQIAYFNLPDEKSATDWAIEWLSNSENRKKAKAFEKKFFACFEK